MHDIARAATLRAAKKNAAAVDRRRAAAEPLPGYEPAWLNQSISGASSRNTTVDTSTAPAAVSPIAV